MCVYLYAAEHLALLTGIALGALKASYHTDSMAIYFVKGRLKEYSVIIRPLMGLLVCKYSTLHVNVHYIPTSLNPADASSRTSCDSRNLN